MTQATKDNQSTSQSPMIWVIIATIALIMVFIFFSGRPETQTEQISLGTNKNEPKFTGEIARQEIQVAPVEKNAREIIHLARSKGEPYPLEQMYLTALEKQKSADMENAHLLFFFTAREGYLPSILKMGEMADPLLFNSNESLLDQADPIQAYKWYKIGIGHGSLEAKQKMAALQEWSKQKADAGNKIAQQLQLNFSGGSNE